MHIHHNIVVTGAAGFIGSYLTGYLNQVGFENLILVDNFSDERKFRNLENKKFLAKIDREEFFDWYAANPGSVDAVFHLGARTDTTEMDYEVHRKWNLEYSKKVWELCTRDNIPLLYASSAATYGGGELGYTDSHEIVPQLQPLNPYGQSKNDFDAWALQQESNPPNWYGVKFFNVFGPNEYHKGRMASVILHAYRQIKEKGEVKLFRSHHPDFEDGGQKRDFIYVKDVARMCVWLLMACPSSGLYNIGTGRARTFHDLVSAVFDTLKMQETITFIDTPEDIRDKYQYFTRADMKKFLATGYDRPFYTLEQGIYEYVSQYLEKDAVY
ncbi:MAG: ADP-glyceromanno-heptose 6-epimerase [Flavipsychrobacter sp.]|nr:ADP-glyceromanno-heptose 6-epimerase [Flavipsychrobacter sp.]